MRSVTKLKNFSAITSAAAICNLGCLSCGPCAGPACRSSCVKHKCTMQWSHCASSGCCFTMKAARSPVLMILILSPLARRRLRISASWSSKSAKLYGKPFFFVGAEYSTAKACASNRASHRATTAPSNNRPLLLARCVSPAILPVVSSKSLPKGMYFRASGSRRASANSAIDPGVGRRLANEASFTAALGRRAKRRRRHSYLIHSSRTVRVAPPIRNLMHGWTRCFEASTLQMCLPVLPVGCSA